MAYKVRLPIAKRQWMAGGVYVWIDVNRTAGDDRVGREEVKAVHNMS